MTISVAVLQKPDFNVFRMAGQCLRCDGTAKVGHILCRGCFEKIMSGEMSMRPEIVALNSQVNALEKPTIWQPMGVKQQLIPATESTGIINCANCNHRREGEEMYCLKCKNSLVASVGYVNARIGELYSHGPSSGSHCFPTQKVMSDGLWDETDNRTVIANWKHELDLAKAEKGVITARDGDVIARFGRNVKKFRVDEKVKVQIDELKRQRDLLVELDFFEFWWTATSKCSVADSVCAKANMKNESVKESVVAPREMEGLLP